MNTNLLKSVYATIAALFVAMFALPTTAHAQGKARIILEAHNVWQDGSGYQMLLDADHNLYGDKIPADGPLWNDANPPADLYNGFEYKIPADADPSTEPKHMVVDGEDFVDIPAGVYDFCIAAPQAETKIWIAGFYDGPTRADDYKFEAGKTYRFTMHMTEDESNDAAKLTITEEGVTTYELAICGEKVSSENCNDLSVINGVSGTVKYDPTNNVLTLQDATINAGEQNAIFSNINGLKVQVVGTNTLTAKDRSTFSFTAPLLIMGDGVLNVKCEGDCALYASETNLTIENCTVNVEGAYAIAGRNGTSEIFTVKNATVTAVGAEYGSICDFAELNMTGCYISQPSGAKFDPTSHSVALNGETVKDKVVITKDPNAIEVPTADNNTATQGIYTLSGVRRAGELKDLPKGVYIVNGKKVVKP
ncbi:DUF2436 domain-containing protein [Prevotella falsenii]|uniref:DUF2436 domain-containing protein n=1 Tax=Prevotella falsenii TaxID=515414 RepID=UPI00046A91AF|nr:DUF2436 domain-containing protein [Prevotella falsenii]